MPCFCTTLYQAKGKTFKKKKFHGNNFNRKKEAVAEASAYWGLSTCQLLC